MTANDSDLDHGFTDPKLPERLARTLRHEIGDFLQKVYASIAILKARLPVEWSQEREVLTRLRSRAELCRDLLDAVQDFLCPLNLACEQVDLAGLAQGLAALALEKNPRLDLSTEDAGPVLAMVDPNRVVQ